MNVFQMQRKDLFMTNMANKALILVKEVQLVADLGITLMIIKALILHLKEQRIFSRISLEEMIHSKVSLKMKRMMYSALAGWGWVQASVR